MTFNNNDQPISSSEQTTQKEQTAKSNAQPVQLDQTPCQQTATAQSNTDLQTAKSNAQTVQNEQNLQYSQPAVAVDAFYTMDDVQNVADVDSTDLDTSSDEVVTSFLATDIALCNLQDPTINSDSTKNSQQNLSKDKPSKPQKKLFSVENIAVMGILSAISYVLYLIPHFIPVFKLPFFPSWFDFQISDLPALLGGFAIGPSAGAIIILVKCLLKMPFTSTACVGELADIFVGLAFVLPSAIVYKHIHSRKSAVLGMLVGSVFASIIAVIANRFVLVPFYALMYGNGNYQNGMQILVNAVQTIYKQATSQTFYTFYLWLGVVPFNVIRCLVCSLITYFIYKPLSKYLHWEHKTKSAESNQ